MQLQSCVDEELSGSLTEVDSNVENADNATIFNKESVSQILGLDATAHKATKDPTKGKVKSDMPIPQSSGVKEDKEKHPSEKLGKKNNKHH